MENRVVLGVTEKVTIIGNNNKEEEVIARIDTGATSSSIDINLALKLSLGPVTRLKVVKSASAVGKRQLIKAKVKIHDIEMEEEFTLADRAHMTYPILIGQNILKKGNFLIDPLRQVKR